MIFVAAISTPKSTLKTAPVVTDIPITKGTITRVMLFFPPGANGLAHLKLNWGNYQLFPSNQEADFAGGGSLLEWVEAIDITAQPLKLTATTWNEDDTYPHTISVHLVMDPGHSSINVADVIAQVRAAQASLAQAAA